MDSGLLLQLTRAEHPLPADQGKGDRPPRRADVIPLLANQLLHPDRTGRYLVHRGGLRISELLPDGREITRSILHAGSIFTVLDGHEKEADPRRDIYAVERLILMSLSETEIWILPPGP